MGYVSGYYRGDGSHVSGHFRSGSSGSDAFLLAFAVVAVACLIWYVLIGLGYVAWALLWVAWWSLQKLAVLTARAARLARPHLMRVVGVGRSALAWVGSARHDMAKDDATGDNPAVLTVKLVALVVGLFAAIVIGVRVYKWVGRLMADTAQIP